MAEEDEEKRGYDTGKELGNYIKGMIKGFKDSGISDDDVKFAEKWGLTVPKKKETEK